MNAQPKPITLAPELAEAVDAAVAAGEYASPAEAVAEAVREWAERRDNFGYSIEELRELVQEGIDSGIAEDDGSTILNRIRARYLEADSGGRS